MTPRSEQPKERCGFIVLCKWIRVETNLKCPVDNGNIKSCKYDTRSHPHPAPETKQAYRNGYDDGYVLAMNEAGEKIRKAREELLKEPRDCATCNNNHNAIKYVRRLQSCTARVAKKQRMDDLKEGCRNCWSMGKFAFDENKCRGYQGHCEQSSCSRFNWWHAKCNCRIIREYDEQKESLCSQQAGDQHE